MLVVTSQPAVDEDELLAVQAVLGKARGMREEQARAQGQVARQVEWHSGASSPR